MLLLPSQLTVIFSLTISLLRVDLPLVALASSHGIRSKDPMNPGRHARSSTPPEIGIACMFTGPWTEDLLNTMNILGFRCLFSSLYAGRSLILTLPWLCSLQTLTYCCRFGAATEVSVHDSSRR
uniref:Secreted protein n=1 Tax=Triticum urartu TaxID=4572 RepID=A0A8R7UQ75_TRIUA